MIMRIKFVMVAWSASLDGASPEVRMASVRIHEEYVRETGAMAENPSYLPALRTRGHLTPSQADHITEIAKGVIIAFLCRNVQCRFFGMNSQWVPDAGKTHWRCPMCMDLYQPWSTARGSRGM